MPAEDTPASPRGNSRAPLHSSSPRHLCAAGGKIVQPAATPPPVARPSPSRRCSHMHVYIRPEPVELEMREVDAEGLVPTDAELVPMAFFFGGNQSPSFRAMLPSETLNLLRQTLREPVHVGLLAEEPEDPA